MALHLKNGVPGDFFDKFIMLKNEGENVIFIQNAMKEFVTEKRLVLCVNFVNSFLGFCTSSSSFFCLYLNCFFVVVLGFRTSQRH